MKKIIIMFGLLTVAGLASPTYAASTSTLASTSPTQTVKETVQEYFADTPVLIKIARCESKFRQFTDSGNVLRGGAGSQMIGVFQFFDRYHTEPANVLGFDIETVEGNLAYARYIYNIEGTAPWNSSRACWDTPKTNATPAVGVSDDVLRQKIALLEQIIKLLQALIIAKQTGL